MGNSEEKTGTENTGANPNDDKVIAILSYLSLLWIVAYILYGNKKSEYNLYHLKQGLGLLMAYVATWIVAFLIIMIVPILGLLFTLVYIALFVLLILGIINAANGEMKPLPLLGPIAENILKNFK